MKMYKIHYFLISVVMLLAGCKEKSANQNNNTSYTEYKTYYAKGFEAKKYDDYTTVSVRNPWDTTRLLQTYILVAKNKEIPAHLPKGVVIRTPLDHVAAYSAIHCSSFYELNSVGLIKGVCEPEHIKLEAITKGIENAEIVDMGMGTSPNLEKIAMLNPEAIFATPIQGWTYGNLDKLKIPIIETTDYTETSPLGRAEWIRFYSLFIDKEELADSLFNITVKNYNTIKALVKNVAEKPTVFTDTRYMNSWDMPGGNSYMANLLNDAGADYLWKNEKSAIFIPLSFEAVLDKAVDADIWMIKYYSPKDMTYTSLKKEFKPYSFFKAFKQRNIWGCNTSYSGYYEDTVIHPDYLLKDLACIFHPELFSNYSTKYYKRLAE